MTSVWMAIAWMACRGGDSGVDDATETTASDAPVPYDCDSLQSLVVAEASGAEDCEAADADLRAKFLDPNGLAPPASGLGGQLQFMYLPPCTSGAADCAPDEEVRCLDGTRPGVYVDPAVEGRCSESEASCTSSEDCEGAESCERNDWLFYVQGGLSCFDGASCYRDFVGGPNRDMSTSPDPGASGPSATTDRSSDDGILGRHARNPFRRYNRVRLHKCTYDRFAGNRTTTQVNPATGHQVKLYFHGRRQWEAAFRTFARAQGPVTLPDGVVLDDLRDAEHVAVVGFSGGARALAQMADDLVDRVLEDTQTGLALDAPVHIVLDGGFQPMIETEVFHAPTGGPSMAWPPPWICEEDCQLDPAAGHHPEVSIYDHVYGQGTLPPDAAGNAPTYSLADFLQETTATIPEEYAGQGLALDASCLASAAHIGDPDPCYDSVHVITNHLAAPVFLRMSLRDDRHVGRAPGYASDDTYAWREEDLRSRIWLQSYDYLNAFADPVAGSELATCGDPTFRTAQGGCEPIPVDRTPALYVPDRTQHMGLGRNWGLGVGQLPMTLTRCDDSEAADPVSPAQAIHDWIHQGVAVQALEGLTETEGGAVQTWAGACL